jgi:long-chain acyl-CoA synthetase
MGFAKESIDAIQDDPSLQARNIDGQRRVLRKRRWRVVAYRGNRSHMIRESSRATAAAERDLTDVARVLAALPRRLHDIVVLNAARNPQRIALRMNERVWTYADLDAATNAVEARLRVDGVRAGDRVMLVAENCTALVALLFGVSKLDAWATIVNARLSAREIDAIRAHCRPRCVIYLAQVSSEAADHARRHAFSDGPARPFDIGAMGEVLVGVRDDDCEVEPVGDAASDQVATLVYTSGTTGTPKGVMLTHRNLLYIARVSSTLRALDADDSVYGVLPISHIYGLASVTLGTLLAGACLHLETRFSPQAMIKALTRHRVTVLQGVPSMYAKLVDALATTTARLDAPQLRASFAGGSPLDAALKAHAERVLGVTLHNGYGLTESSPTVSHTRLDAPRSDCSVGPPLPGVEIRIVGGAGGRVADGEPGTLHVRGPNVMRGYYRNSALTAQVIDSEGWLDTGDIARQDASGALFIVGRAKELIIRSGFNVYPAEVEAVLNAHPAVVQSAVVGRPVPGNEEVVAFVELAPGKDATAEELGRYLARELAPYKRPAQINIVTALPVAANGKILKHRLAQVALRAVSISLSDANVTVGPDPQPGL